MARSLLGVFSLLLVACGAGDPGSGPDGASPGDGGAIDGAGDGAGPDVGSPLRVQDDFERAAMGTATWAPAGGGENLVILNGSVAGSDGNSSFGCRGAQWTANDGEWAIDTYTQVTLPVDVTRDALFHVGVRVGGDGANQNYGCGYYQNLGPCPSGWVLKRDGGPGGTGRLDDCADDTRTCYFGCGGTEIPAPIGGEVVRIESRWNPTTSTNDLTCLVTVGATTYQYGGSDDVLTLPGRPRIVTCEGTPDQVSKVFEDFEAGNL